VCAEGLHLIGKLRSDANLRWYFKGQYKGRGCPRKYDGKVHFQNDLERFESIETTEEGIEIYSAVVEAKNGKRKLRVVLLRWEKKEEGTVGTAILFSTDPALSASKIVEYYRARFQIEFLFRDAKQHTGLMDCQARSSEAIHMHINASFVSQNLLNLEDRREKQSDHPLLH